MRRDINRRRRIKPVSKALIIAAIVIAIIGIALIIILQVPNSKSKDISNILSDNTDNNTSNEQTVNETNSDKNATSSSNTTENTINKDTSSQNKTTTFNMLLTGDIMCHNTMYRDAYDSANDTYDFTYMFDDIKYYIQTADIAVRKS